MLGQLAGKDETNAGLDLSRGDGRLLRVGRELYTTRTRQCATLCLIWQTRTGSLSSDALEDVVDERVENGHSLVRDTRVRVNLLKDYAAHTRQTRVNIVSAEKLRDANIPL